MTCSICNGTGKQTDVVLHPHTGKNKVISIPCVCFTSTVVSREHKLLQHLGDQFIHPDKLDPHLLLNFEDLGANKNLIIEGSFDAFLLMVKALIMKHRFDPRKPRILFSRSIDIVHDYHVPQDDGTSQHLSATSAFDLVVAVFGSIEVNKAISPCMAELVSTRLQEKRPTWIYFMSIMNPKSQEYSEEMLTMLDNNFSKVTVHTDQSIEKINATESKRLASKF